MGWFPIFLLLSRFLLCFSKIPSYLPISYFYYTSEGNSKACEWNTWNIFFFYYSMLVIYMSWCSVLILYVLVSDLKWMSITYVKIYCCSWTEIQSNGFICWANFVFFQDRLNYLCLVVAFVSYCCSVWDIVFTLSRKSFWTYKWSQISHSIPERGGRKGEQKSVK